MARWIAAAAALVLVAVPGADARAQTGSFSPDVLDSLSIVAHESGDLEAARDLAVRAAELRDETAAAPDADVAIGWHEAGLAHYRVEDYERAVGAIGRAVAVWELVPDADPTDVVWAQSDLAEMCRLTGRWTEAEKHLEESIARARASGDPGGFLPVLLNNLGTLLWDQDRLDEAEPLLRESLALRAADPDTPPLARARGHQNLGVILRSQQRWIESEREFRAGLALARASGGPDRREVVPYLNGLAGLLSRTGDPAAALALRDESLGILDGLERPPRPLLADILEEAGRDLLEAGRASEAPARFARSREIRRELFGEEHPGVGTAWLGIARAEAAEHGAADARVGAAADSALARLAGAPLHAEQRAQALALRARSRRAGADPAGADPAGAVDDLRAAVALLDTLRAQRGGLDETRLLFSEEYRRETDDLISWLVHDGDVLGPAGALAEAQRLRGRLLAEQLSSSQLGAGRDLPEDVRLRLDEEETSALVLVNETRRRLRAVAAADLEEADRTQRIAALDSTLASSVLELRDVRGRRRLLDPRWASMLREQEGAGAAVELAAGEAVLLYHIGYRESFVFWAGPDGRAAFDVAPLSTPDGKPLTSDRLRETWEGVGESLRRPRGVTRGVTGTTPVEEVKKAGETQAALAALGGTLLPGAAREGIAGADRVTILPDGVLHAVPFEALRVPGGSGDVWALDTLPPVRYAASLRAGRRDAPGNAESVLIVADPATKALPALPGARLEADAVAAAFPAARVTRLEGAGATEAALVAALPGSSVLHFAGHGLADRGPGGLLAALVLAPPPSGPGAVDLGSDGAGGRAPGEGTDGYLHLFELYELDLPCDLVWLSACDTNAGPILAGEGAFALSRGFLVAGVRDVVASLWPLHDDSARELVTAFFAGSRPDGAAGPAEAPEARLRAAKRSLRDRWPDPHHWAPFVLLGQGPGARW